MAFDVRSTEPLGHLDTVHWHATRIEGVNPGGIGVFILDGPIDLATAREAIGGIAESQFLRFRQRVVERGRRLHWEALPVAAAEAQVEAIEVDLPLREAVLEHAARLSVQSYPTNRPPWNLHVVTSRRDGRSALMWRLHHAMTDGARGSEAMFRLYSATPPGRETEARDLEAHHREVKRKYLEPGASANAPKSTDKARSPTGLWQVFRAAIPPSRQGSTLLTNRGAGRYFDVVEMDPGAIIRLKRHAGTRFSDVMVALTVIALGRYHARMGAPVPETLIISTPFNAGGLGTEGNAYMEGNLRLPTATSMSVSFLRELGRRSDVARAAQGTRLAQCLAGLAGEMPPWLLAKSFEATWRRGIDFLCINLPGSPMPFWFQDREIVDMWYASDTFGQPGSISWITYRNRLKGFCALDKGAFSAPQLFLECLSEVCSELESDDPDEPRTTA